MGILGPNSPSWHATDARCRVRVLAFVERDPRTFDSKHMSNQLARVHFASGCAVYLGLRV